MTVFINSFQVTAGAPPTLLNLALTVNGGTLSASSTYSAGYPVSACNNEDRKGLGWGSGGGWNSAGNPTSGSPEWIEVAFDGTKVVDEVDVITIQDAYSSPSEPDLAMTFGTYGIIDYKTQYWNGSTWVDVDTVTSNNKVWRQFAWASIVTTKVRLYITLGAAAGYARMVEVEAWGTAYVAPPVGDFIDGGSWSAAYTDIIDGGDVGDEWADIIDGGGA